MKTQTQQMLEAQRTEEEREEIQVEKVRRMREKRSQLTITGKKLARIQANEGMREHRRFGSESTNREKGELHLTQGHG